MANLLSRWRRHPWSMRLKLVQATFALIIAKLLLITLPLRWVIRLTGTYRQGTPAPESDSENPRYQLLGKALRASARHLPFSATCLVQAVAGALILRFSRRKPTIVLGIQKKVATGFAAHAWLVCDGCMVTGGEGHEDYQVIANLVGT